jgi:excisionase family DNA binding protein
MTTQAVTNFLTVADVAARLALSEPTVRRRIASGDLPAVRLATSGRAAVHVSEHDLRGWLAERSIAGAAE